MAVAAAPAPPCPFCGEQLVVRRCYGFRHLRCPKCTRGVCYRAAGGQLAAESCRGVEAFDIEADRCPGCGGAFQTPCPRQKYLRHLWCSVCDFCWATTKKRVKCATAPRPPKRCHHCGGSGQEPPAATPKKDKALN